VTLVPPAPRGAGRHEGPGAGSTGDAGESQIPSQARELQNPYPASPYFLYTRPSGSIDACGSNGNSGREEHLMNQSVRETLRSLPYVGFAQQGPRIETLQCMAIEHSGWRAAGRGVGGT